MLSFFLTSKCNIECDHCCLNSGPRRAEYLNVDFVESIISKLSQFGFNELILTGGEPSLLGRQLFDLSRSAKRYVETIRLVSNSSWAGTEASALRFLEHCLETGISEVALSTSDFHQAFVPIEKVARAWHAARSLPFDVVVVVASHESNDQYHDAIAADLAALAPKNPQVSCRASKVTVTRVQRIGRFQTHTVPTGRHNIYGKSPYRVRCPAAVTSPAISADGHLWVCAGMDLTGNEFLDFGPITPNNVVDRYRDMQRSTIPMAIRYLGPGFLLKFIATKDGLEYNRDLISFCEICQDLTRKPEFKAGLVRHEAEIRSLLREKLRELGLPDIDEQQPTPVGRSEADQA